MKKFFKRFFIVLLFGFIVIQFIRPAKNNSTDIYANDISTKYIVPKNVETILVTSCYDCHSNNTNYPWYNNIQPVAWYLKHHVDEGKAELNFSAFGTYKISRQYKKLAEINEQIEKGEMPMTSYTLIHKNAILTDTQKIILRNWVNTLRDNLKATYPADSFKRPQKQISL